VRMNTHPTASRAKRKKVCRVPIWVLAATLAAGICPAAAQDADVGVAPPSRLSPRASLQWSPTRRLDGTLSLGNSTSTKSPRLAPPIGVVLPAGVPDPCPAAAAITVRFETEVSEPLLRRTKSIAALSAVKSDGPGRTIGLFTDTFAYAASLEGKVNTVTGPYTLACVWPTEVHVLWAKKDRVIDIATEIPIDSCLDREVIGHERRHASVSESTAAHWRSTAESAVVDAAAAISPVRFVLGPGQDPNAILAAMTAKATAALKPVADRRAAEEGLGQMNVDSPEEYHRLGLVCGGAAQRLAH